jgi:hypothetical protein
MVVAFEEWIDLRNNELLAERISKAVDVENKIVMYVEEG